MKNFATTMIRAFEARLIDQGQLLDAFMDLTEKQYQFRIRQDNLDGVERMEETEINEQIAILKAFLKERNGRLKK